MIFHGKLENIRPMKLLKLSPWNAMLGITLATLVLGGLYHSLLGLGIRGNYRKLGLVVKARSRGPGEIPVFAYWISGTGGEDKKMFRLLEAVYHPRNLYLLHLDSGASDDERINLLRTVQSEKVFRTFKNVDVIGKSYAVDRTGPSALSATLHGAAILLRLEAEWDWFITLSSSDYPIVTQDDLLHAFTPLPRNLNFIEHTSELGWKEYDRFDRIVVDPSLYMDKTIPSFVAKETRETPVAFTVFTGSPWVILSRPFVKHVILGWDNVPRNLLMYFANVAYSMEAYFQTVICNSPEFKNTTVNNDLRYFKWDDPPGLNPLFLNQSHYKPMIKSGAAFARRFMENDTVLRKIDKRILRRSVSRVGVGKWCEGQRVSIKDYDPCLKWSNINVVEPRPLGKYLRKLVLKLISDEKLHSNQCKVFSAEPAL